MGKIYVDEEFVNYNCIVPNSNYIRIYETQPMANTTTNYIDLYTTNHHYFTRGTVTNGSYYSGVTCSRDYTLTNDFYYRNDFDSILLIFLIISIFVFYIPLKLFSRLFGRWFKI